MTFEIAKSKVLVTGGSGFLGTHIVEELKRHGAVNIVIPEYPAVDLRKQAAVRKMFEEEKPDLVIHLAASVGGIGANQASGYFLSRQHGDGTSHFGGGSAPRYQKGSSGRNHLRLPEIRADSIPRG